MKLIAFYLPQFHEIPENNQWWGKGFTEWVNTRNAEPLFHGHYQPREPYSDFYYDLTDPLARKWQAELAKEYGIYGFCYYHYWFNGKMLLEKPFNEVLTSGEPDFPFCLSWANEPWTRRWDGRNDLVLMPQDYGNEKDWKEHFDYLLKAFKDDRYIRVEDKPLFLIYRPAIIPNCSEMLYFWDNLAKQNGLNGIYFVETLNGFYPLTNIKGFDASVEFEPHYSIAHGNCQNIWREGNGYQGRMKVVDYDSMWSCILNRKINTNKKVIPGAFIDWDNTARRGTEATIYYGANPAKFEKYLSKQIDRAETVYKSDFLFINAWNEWAEGTYLEPDKKFQYQYLEAVQKALRVNGINRVNKSSF
ncbi:glycoside hydrolase family 99-like domain-containing protein [Bacillus tianshenii]|nr:glycoside hydrolase family 99-like domain-containing protein [Bacillus tianshenii]